MNYDGDQQLAFQFVGPPRGCLLVAGSFWSYPFNREVPQKFRGHSYFSECSHCDERDRCCRFKRLSVTIQFNFKESKCHDGLFRSNPPS